MGRKPGAHASRVRKRVKDAYGTQSSHTARAGVRGEERLAVLMRGEGIFNRLLHGPARWLRAVPVADPVDMRNAPMFQVVLLLFGTLPLAAWLYRAIAVPAAWRPGALISLALSALFSAACARYLAYAARVPSPSASGRR